MYRSSLIEKYQKLALLLIGLLPASRIKNVLMNLHGCNIGKDCKIEPNIFLRTRNIKLEQGSSIGLGNVFRDLNKLHLGQGSTIRNFNWISASPVLERKGGGSSLTLGKMTSVTSRHYFDCSGGILLGDFTTIAGVRSTLISHQIDIKRGEQSVSPINIGKYCLISSNSAVCPGVFIEDFTVVGMGTVLAGEYCVQKSLIVGPKGQIKKIEISGEYFERIQRSVSDQ